MIAPRYALPWVQQWVVVCGAVLGIILWNATLARF
jgi:hypothetical protein